MLSASFLENLEWPFFPKNYGDRKKEFFFKCITVLQRVKWFLNVKMISLKKLIGKMSAPLLRRPAPALYFHLLPIYNFSDPPSGGGN